MLHGAADVFLTEKLRYSLLNFIFSLDYWSQTVLNRIKSFPGNASERVHSQLPGNKYFRCYLLLLMCWCHIPCWEHQVPFLSGVGHGVSVVAGAVAILGGGLGWPGPPLKAHWPPLWPPQI